MKLDEKEVERRIDDVTDDVCFWIRVREGRRIEVLFVYLTERVSGFLPRSFGGAPAQTAAP